jgi:hypothetical protein
MTAMKISLKAAGACLACAITLFLLAFPAMAADMQIFSAMAGGEDAFPVMADGAPTHYVNVAIEKTASNKAKAAIKMASDYPERPEGTLYADFLKKLELFKGTEKGFELNKTLRRDEAAVMLVRLLGREGNALSGEYAMPFDDVDEWARPYVGWLYENKLTFGVSETKFDSRSAVTSRQYLTFLIRCLGYSETAGDFKYEDVVDFAIEKRFIKDDSAADRFRSERWGFPEEYENFLRYDCVELSFFALTWKTKRSEKALADELMENGVFTEETFTEGLWAFFAMFGLNEDGRIVRKYDADIELPWLGLSPDIYAYTAWEFDDFIVAFADLGVGCETAYIVDTISLERRAMLSQHKIGLADYNLYKNRLYFIEYENDGYSESSITFKYYDWEKNEVAKLLRIDNPLTYNVSDGKLTIVGEANGKNEYNVIDFDTGKVTNCISADSGILSVIYIDSSLFITNTLDDKVICFIYDAEILTDTLSMPKASNGNGQETIFDLYDAGMTPRIAYINNSLIKIDTNKKMTLAAGFDENVVWALAADDGKVYVLPGDGVFGRELGVTGADGAYSVLVPEKIIGGLNVTKIIGYTKAGNVTFISEIGIGMQHFDTTIYEYDHETKKVAAKDFTPGRNDPSVMGVHPINGLEEARKRLAELQE